MFFAERDIFVSRQVVFGLGETSSVYTTIIDKENLSCFRYAGVD